MTKHLDTEVLSAHIDNAVDPRLGQGALQHLAGCQLCAERLRAMQSVAASLGQMPGVEPTEPESRRLREAIADARASHRRGPAGTSDAAKSFRFKPSGTRRGGLAAAIVLVSLAIAATASLIPFRTPRQQQADLPPDLVLDIASATQVRGVVSSDRDVRERAEALTVADVAANRSAQLPKAADGGDQAELSASVWIKGSDKACTDKVLETQPYPMVPVYARKATFESKPAWLLVYLWSTSTEDDAPLDRVQAWVFAPKDCATYSGQELVSKALHYSFFKL